MKYSKRVSYIRNGKTISYTREYSNKYGKHVKIVKNRRTGKSYAYKEYTVNGKKVRRRIKNLVKNGKVTQYGEEWLEEYKRNLDFSDQNELRAILYKAQRNRETITIEGLTSRLSNTKIERFIYNMGGEVDDLAADLGVEEEELLDQQRWKNWDSNPTFEFEGVTYEFTFDYDTHSITWKAVNYA